MRRIAFIFPGQGAQYVGMGKDIVEKYEIAADIFTKASNAVGYDMKKLCFEGPEEELIKTENTQPAILTTCIAIAKVLEDKGIKADVSAGLSLGEYAALVVSGALSFEDAVALVKKRGRYMQEAVPIGKGAMAAILGMERNTLLQVLKQVQSEGIVEAANFNSPGQIVISGEVKAVEKACEAAKEAGALKAVLLPVSAPFHCSMLIPAGEKLAGDLDRITINELHIPVIANVNADYYQNKCQVNELLIKQVSHSVLWEDTMLRMLEDGVNTFIEMGPGKSLNQFLKKILKKSKHNAEVYSIEDGESLETVLNSL
ncbi:[acyl-carrier-protein] S-malonyltransferase [Geosporobacter subterraneus DSM 17957]|uniref:Malonyl CoA-acyl carrier protein transacylase n=1 Tax=Geosporobacter subterraneus DSM 17957 TaxID=1121919 RepID=A0A1M6E7R0_9FIRM|nr:ACP S-malonyltransferase [Geosporobacter subterraneus]SHI81390.1 [acyl-carrier-protein] S-malonyltransferase [Geosporobacter subterraneus DSM 17957]